MRFANLCFFRLNRKRHITGGLLLSGALLFGGLAMTVMSIRDDEEDEDE